MGYNIELTLIDVWLARGRADAMASDDKKQWLAASGLVLGLGINLAATTVVGLVLGKMADAWLGTSPWGVVAGIILGVLSGIWSAYKRITGFRP
ncbi:MAG: AtpZ/AtpI family protein [Negativicutes bacterium]|nr:AtpZ/AtpI family protein [Negativicutes bacterium]